MAIDLPQDLEERARAHVTPDEYPSVAEVVRAALDALEREDQRGAAKLAKLRAALEEGDASGDALPGVFERLRVRHGLASSG